MKTWIQSALLALLIAAGISFAHTTIDQFAAPEFPTTSDPGDPGAGNGVIWFDGTKYKVREGTGDPKTISESDRPFGFYMGADNGEVLADADDAPTCFWNQLGYAITITECCAESDGGTPTIMLQRDDGTPADIFAANLTASTSGACTTSFSGSENVVADDEKVDCNTVTAGGVAKRWALHCRYTVP